MSREPERAAGVELSWRSPALGLVALAAFASALVSVTTRVDDPDLWQHLAVGRFVWVRHALPLVHQWTWPLWGTPDVNPSWGFEALLWPFWDRGGLAGLFAWRWLTTLGAFAFLWAAARRLGARGLTPAFVIAWCALTWRLRSDLRPETFAAVLFAAMLWILETRRQGGPDRRLALVPLAWAWANSHVSYPLGLFLIALHLCDEWLRGRRGRGAAGAARVPGGSAGGTRAPGGSAGDARIPGGSAGGTRPGGATEAAPVPRRLVPLAWIALAAVAVSFLNPFGWRALAQPFQFLLFWRHEPVFQNIPELAPPDWRFHWRSGLPLLMALWPLLAAWRARRAGFDRVEWGLLALTTAEALGGRRFVGVYALAAVPYLSRDLSEWLATRGGARPRLPLGLRAAGVALACFAIGPLEWSRWDVPMGIAVEHGAYVIGATDFMAAHGVRGRGLNTFGMAGWQVYRFWPDRSRLPFMDIHQSGSREDRDLYAFAQTDSNAWKRLDAKYRFDYVLLARVQYAGDRLLNTLDRDPAFALVFKDDAGALFVRRAGPLAAVARDFAYRVVPAGNAALGALGEAAARDSALRAAVRVELEREVRGSPWHAQATSLLANLALIDGDWGRARALLDTTMAIDARRPRVDQRLGLLDLMDGRPRSALRHFAREAEIHGAAPDLDLAAGQAWVQLGRYDRARAACRRALHRDPAFTEAADSLKAWERRGG